jgi:hypothetical protein
VQPRSSISLSLTLQHTLVGLGIQLPIQSWRGAPRSDSRKCACVLSAHTSTLEPEKSYRIDWTLSRRVAAPRYPECFHEYHSTLSYNHAISPVKFTRPPGYRQQSRADRLPSAPISEPPIDFAPSTRFQVTQPTTACAPCFSQLATKICSSDRPHRKTFIEALFSLGFISLSCHVITVPTSLHLPNRRSSRTIPSSPSSSQRLLPHHPPNPSTHPLQSIWILTEIEPFFVCSTIKSWS